jgi:hypothetical protein
MSVVGKRWFRVTGTLVASGTLVLAGQAAADAKSRCRPDPAPVISITATTDAGFSLPKVVHAGLTTFRVGTPEVGSFHGIQGFRLNHGVTLAQAMDEINRTLGSDRAEAAMGVMDLTRDVTEIGVITTTSYAPQEVTIPLTAGTYYFLDLNDVNNPPLTPRLHTLKVVGRYKSHDAPRYSATFEASMINSEPRFQAPATFPHDGTFRGVITGDELHEIVFRPVRPGVDDAYISSFYDAVVNGTPRPPSPWTGGAAGMQSMSPGRSGIVHLNLPPGPYALVCYVPSDESGLPHAYIGMHQIITLT